MPDSRRSVDDDAPTAPIRAGAVRDERADATRREDRDDRGETQEPSRDQAPPAARWFARGLVGLLAVVGLVVLVLFLVARVAHLPDLNPFDSKTTDRSQPALLKSVRDLSRFVAAEGDFQVVVDLQNNRDNVPEFLLNERTLFVAAGSVESYVDFAALDKGAVKVVDDDTVEVTLPAPELGRPSLDVDKSYAYSEQRGLLNRLGDLVGSGAGDDQQQLYELADQKIAAAATRAGLTDRAEANTEKTLDGLFGSLGYDDVRVTFTGGADDR
ncbi:DUF4230 domain-containing protein [Marmoricola endophyticus]|uniref:DUF4230 domain-containing protein n=1 Tax=Marmoricola endophyticus TaxID=2040280 RepID=UPI001E45516B|nr:DUF4230 domain-containing protein [Marmoricola endophyticus]